MPLFGHKHEFRIAVSPSHSQGFAGTYGTRLVVSPSPELRRFKKIKVTNNWNIVLRAIVYKVILKVWVHVLPVPLILTTLPNRANIMASRKMTNFIPGRLSVRTIIPPSAEILVLTCCPQSTMHSAWSELWAVGRYTGAKR